MVHGSKVLASDLRLLIHDEFNIFVSLYFRVFVIVI